MLITQSYPALCNAMDCSPPDSSVHWDSPGKNAGVILAWRIQARIQAPMLESPSPGDLPHPGIEAGSPAWQADSLPSEPPRKYYLDRMVIKRFHNSIYMSSWSFSSAGRERTESPERTE